MKDMNLNGLKDIKADKELIERTVSSIMINKKSKKYFNLKKAAVVAASLVFILGAAGTYGATNKLLATKNSNNIAENKGIKIPAIKPGEGKGKGVAASMVALVVYKGKVYTQSAAELPADKVKSFLGDKIGRTVNSINEWNVKDKSKEEMASNIGEQDVYKVKGYDDDFRIMSYSEEDGTVNAQLFDCLNGITVRSGKDVFEKLKIADNVTAAKFMTFDDWNNGKNKYTDLKDLNLLNKGLKDLNSGIPYEYSSISDTIDNARNNENFRQLVLDLKDGLQVKLQVFKNGYVSYGISGIYFKVDKAVINELWQ